MNPVPLTVSDVHAGYNGLDVLRGVTFGISAGEFLAIVGPNGAGKTTLLRTIVGEMPVTRGEILINGIPIREWDRRELATFMAYVPQSMTVNPSMKVLEYVMLGRYAHMGRLKPPRKADWDAVDQALELTGTADLRSRPLSRLSMGELQRVRTARALAQEPTLLVLDEPLAHMDPGHKFQMMEILNQLTGRGLSVVAAIHDIEIVPMFADTALLLTGQRCIVGHCDDVLTPENISEAFHVRAIQCEGRLLLLPMGNDPAQKQEGKDGETRCV